MKAKIDAKGDRGTLYKGEAEDLEQCLEDVIDSLNDDNSAYVHLSSGDQSHEFLVERERGRWYLMFSDPRKDYATKVDLEHVTGRGLVTFPSGAWDDKLTKQEFKDKAHDIYVSHIDHYQPGDRATGREKRLFAEHWKDWKDKFDPENLKIKINVEKFDERLDPNLKYMLPDLDKAGKTIKRSMGRSNTKRVRMAIGEQELVLNRKDRGWDVSYSSPDGPMSAFQLEDRGDESGND